MSSLLDYEKRDDYEVGTQRVTVTLSKEEISLAGNLGRLRCMENKGRADIGDYDHKRFNLTSLQNNCLAVMGEMAAVKFLGFDDEVVQNQHPDIWAGFVRTEDYHLLKQPDIASKFEVRTCRKRSNPVPVRWKDVKAEAIILHVYVDFDWTENGTKVKPTGEVEILGWADAVEDWKTGSIPAWSMGDARVVERRPLNTLDLEGLL